MWRLDLIRMRRFHERDQMNFTLNVRSVLYYLINRRSTVRERIGKISIICHLSLWSSKVSFNDPLSHHVVFSDVVCVWYVYNDPCSRLIRVDDFMQVRQRRSNYLKYDLLNRMNHSSFIIFWINLKYFIFDRVAVLFFMYLPMSLGCCLIGDLT